MSPHREPTLRQSYGASAERYQAERQLGAFAAEVLRATTPSGQSRGRWAVQQRSLILAKARELGLLEAPAAPATIEASHGTVCPRCLLWPDLCSCKARELGLLDTGAGR